MNERVVVCGPREGRTLLVGGGDCVTYKARGADTGGSYFCFEASTSPGFGPPLHAHAWRELFYVLEGEYEFSVEEDGRLRTLTGTAGTVIAVPPNVPHTFRNATDEPARLLFFHQPAALEEFFEELGVPVGGEAAGADRPVDPNAIVTALERNGVHVAAAPA